MILAIVLYRWELECLRWSWLGDINSEIEEASLSIKTMRSKNVLTAYDQSSSENHGFRPENEDESRVRGDVFRAANRVAEPEPEYSFFKMFRNRIKVSDLETGNAILDVLQKHG